MDIDFIVLCLFTRLSVKLSAVMENISPSLYSTTPRLDLRRLAASSHDDAARMLISPPPEEELRMSRVRAPRCRLLSVLLNFLFRIRQGRTRRQRERGRRSSRNSRHQILNHGNNYEVAHLVHHIFVHHTRQFCYSHHTQTTLMPTTLFPQLTLADEAPLPSSFPTSHPPTFSPHRERSSCRPSSVHPSDARSSPSPSRKNPQ